MAVALSFKSFNEVKRMSLFKRKKQQEARAEVIASDMLLRALIGNAAATKQKALEIPTLSGCIEYIANTIAMIPIKLYREEQTQEGKGNVSEVIDDDRIVLLNDETGDTLDAAQFWKAMVSDYFLGKGAYAYIDKVRNAFVGLYYVDEEAVSIAKNSDPIFKDYWIIVGGRVYQPHEFIKVIRKTKDGAQGRSLIEENPMIISVGYNTLKFENNLVEKGGNKKGFLQSESVLAQENVDQLKEAWKNLYSNNEENIVVLNKGLSFQEASNSSVEMQLNENKETNATEICKLFNVPESIIKGTASPEEYITGFKLAVMPVIRAIECALNRDFLLEKEKRGSSIYYWAFDTKEITKGDIKARYEAYRTAIEANFMQIDEVRYQEDMEPLGLNFVKLGLNDVLFDPTTNTVYTPNTNQLTTIGLKGGVNHANRDPE